MRPPCSVEGCDRPLSARGRCKYHYEKWRLAGGVTGDLATPPSARLWNRTERQPNGCLLFTGALTRGYGEIAQGPPGAAPAKAHRVAWEDTYGPIPDGLWVLHRCDVRNCVEPTHLFLGDNAANVADMIAKGRHYHQLATHCKRGHPLSGDNLRFVKGARTCRTCRAAATRAWRERKKAS